MAYSVIIFDYDGTLASSKPVIIERILSTCRHFSLPLPSENTLKKVLQKGTCVFTALLAESADLQAYSQAEQQQWQRHFEQSSCLPTLFLGIYELVQKLHSDYSIHLVSNQPQTHSHIYLKQQQLLSYFSSIHGPNLPSIREKPYIDMFALIKNQHPKVPLSRFLMIGDTVADAAFAHNAGIDFALAAYGFGINTKATTHLPIHYTLNQPSDLLRILAAHA